MAPTWQQILGHIDVNRASSEHEKRQIVEHLKVLEKVWKEFRVLSQVKKGGDEKPEESLKALYEKLINDSEETLRGGNADDVREFAIAMQEASHGGKAEISKNEMEIRLANIRLSVLRHWKSYEQHRKTIEEEVELYIEKHSSRRNPERGQLNLLPELPFKEWMFSEAEKKCFKDRTAVLALTRRDKKHVAFPRWTIKLDAGGEEMMVSKEEEPW